MTQENSALVPGNYDNLPREAKKTKDSTFDRVYKYYHNENTRLELTPEEHKIRERWEKAWFLLCRHRTRKQVVDLIEKLFHIEKSVAYDDVKKAMMLFSDPQDDLKEAKRAIAETAFLQGADRAWKYGHLDLHLKYMKEYAEINKLNEAGDQNLLADLLKKLKPTQIVIVSNTKDLEREAQQLQDDLIRDIEFTELKDDQTESSEN